MYICVLKRPREQSLKVNDEFISAHNSVMDAAVMAYSYMIDGHQTEVLQFRPNEDRCVVYNWSADPIFFSAVKSTFLTQESERKYELALSQKLKKPLRPDDV